MKFFKKAIAFLGAAIMAVSALSVTASAENPDKVIDNADLLSDTEELALESQIAAVIEKYNNGYDIVILTSNGTDGKSITAFADDYYDYNGYGYDSVYSGLIFVVDMSGRQWYISTCGKAIDAFTDYGLDDIGNSAANYLSNGNYQSGFSTFIKLADEYIYQYESTGIPYDVRSKRKDSPEAKKEFLSYFLSSAVIGLIVALAVCLTLKSQLKSAKMQINAQQYIRSGSFRVTNMRDIFLYKTVSKTRRESSSGGGHSGGSSTHRSSSGRSHGGRGGRF